MPGQPSCWACAFCLHSALRILPWASYIPSWACAVCLVVALQPVEDPQKLTRVIMEALQRTGQRGIIQKGWGGLGQGEGTMNRDP